MADVTVEPSTVTWLERAFNCETADWLSIGGCCGSCVCTTGATGGWFDSKEEVEVDGEVVDSVVPDTCDGVGSTTDGTGVGVNDGESCDPLVPSVVEDTEGLLTDASSG